MKYFELLAIVSMRTIAVS